MNNDVLEPELLHRFKNHMCVAIGFCQFLLDDMPSAHPLRDDLCQIQQAMEQAMAVVPELTRTCAGLQQ